MIKYNHIINDNIGITLIVNSKWQGTFDFIEGNNNSRYAPPKEIINGEKYWECYSCKELVNKSEIHSFLYNIDNNKLYEFKKDDIILEYLKHLIKSIKNFEPFIDNITNETISNLQSLSYDKDAHNTLSNIHKILRLYNNNLHNKINAISKKIDLLLDYINNLFNKINYTDIKTFYTDYEILRNNLHKYIYRNNIPSFLNMDINYSNDYEIKNSINKIIQKISSVSDFVKTNHNKYNNNLFSSIYEFYDKIKNKKLYEYSIKYIEQPLCKKCYKKEAYFCNDENCNFSSLYDDDFIEIDEEININKSNQKSFDFIDNIKNKPNYYCKNHAFTCSNCENGFRLSDEKYFIYDGDKYCEYCSSEIFTKCSYCDDDMIAEHALYDENDYNYSPYCSRTCLENALKDKKTLKNEVKDFQPSGIGKYYPIDQTALNASVIPALELAKSKLKPNSSLEEYINFAIKRIQKQDAKNAVITKSKHVNSIDELIEFFKNQSKEYERVKSEYPNLKGIKFLPVRIEIEKTKNHIGTAFVIYPTEELLDYADSIIPNAKYVYERFLSRMGHHPGALGYARVTKSNGNIIIDNLQTDLDRQAYSDRNINPEYKQALNWWFSTIKNFWAVYLLDALKQFGKNLNTKIYLTDFDMQKEKWGSVPERNRDIYDKLPKLMNMEKEWVLAEPEDFPKGDYYMSRVASNLLQLSNLFLKISK